MSRYPIAFVDESFLDRQGHPGFYLLAANIVEGPDLDTTIAAARAASTDTEFHAAILHHRGHMRVIEDMLDTVEQHAAWTAVVVHTPLGPAKEVARQTSLRQLLTYLDRQRVRDVILDTRGPERSCGGDHPYPSLARPHRSRGALAGDQVGATDKQPPFEGHG